MDWAGIFSSALSDMLGPFAAIYALATLGLNVHFGYTGLLNFGQVAFMMVGAFGIGVGVVTFGLSIWWGLAIAIVASVALALLLGIPTLRLRGDYLAIATIAAGETLRLFFNSSYFEPLTNGPFGLGPSAGEFEKMNPFDAGKKYGIGPFQYQGRDLWTLSVTWGLVLLSCLLIFLLMRSPWGRVMRSIREDELAARSLGKNVYSFKIQSLVLGGVLGGLAGVMWTMDVSTQYPASFDPKVTFYLWVIMILGGAGRIFGPVLGSIIFWFVFSWLGSFLTNLAPAINTGAARIAVVGLALMLLMVFRPAGILGNKEEMRLEVR
ncbi:MAG: branched-chain amino acid ABC transporter permease [Nakamurella sp.]